MRRNQLLPVIFSLFALVVVHGGAEANYLGLFRSNSAAAKTSESNDAIAVSFVEEIGYFYECSGSPQAVSSRRGLLILPEEGVAADAYASYARGIPCYQDGYFVVVLERATASHVVKAMLKEPRTEFWSIAGHGKGGMLAAELALTLQPKVKALVLMGSALPPGVNLSSENIYVAVVYFGKDHVVTPASVIESFSLLPGDAVVQFLPDLNHYSFVDSSWRNKTRHDYNHSEISVGASESDRNAIQAWLLYSLALAQWAAASLKAVSYGDNEKLTPGRSDSKPYPGEIRVKFEAVPIPGSSPQRMLWVFVPGRVKGGLIYYGGAAVDTRAYWPLAFEIAARGHLVVIPQQPNRNAHLSFTDANMILDSELKLFSEVPTGRWAIGGHSYGASAATIFAASYSERIYALVLHDGGWARNMTESPLPAISLYGTLDLLMGNYDAYRTMAIGYANLKVTSFVPIEGGNHGQVGDYGPQSGDGVATISLEEEHAIYAEKTVKFLDNVGESSGVRSYLRSFLAMWTAV